MTDVHCCEVKRDRKLEKLFVGKHIYKVEPNKKLKSQCLKTSSCSGECVPTAYELVEIEYSATTDDSIKDKFVYNVTGCKCIKKPQLVNNLVAEDSKDAKAPPPPPGAAKTFQTG